MVRYEFKLFTLLFDFIFYELWSELAKHHLLEFRVTRALLVTSFKQQKKFVVQISNEA